MLRRMRRGHGGKQLYDVVDRLRSRVPGLVFRTTFVVGHPGETDEEFEQLCEFVRFARFDHVGVFTYSDEETSHSFTLPNKVPAGVAAERAERLMALQREISQSNNRTRLGQSIEVLVEGPSEESELVMVGRHAGQAPDIDGIVYISGGPVRPGRMYTGVVADTTDYDLVVDVGELDDEPLGPKTPSVAPLLQRHTDGRVTLRTV
jgi:ribosomal protein S12 methylthiotransferase